MHELKPNFTCENVGHFQKLCNTICPKRNYSASSEFIVLSYCLVIEIKMYHLRWLILRGVLICTQVWLNKIVRPLICDCYKNCKSASSQNCEKDTCIYECTKFLICQVLQDIVFQFLLSRHWIEWDIAFLFSHQKLISHLCQSHMAFAVNRAVV